METTEKVIGMADQAKAVIYGKDTVYVHSDIRPYTPPDADGAVSELYIYNEDRYSYEEYMRVTMAESERIKAELTAAQLALCELYEAANG